MNDCFAALDQAFPGKKLSELFLRNERSPTQRTRLNIDEGATSEREREESIAKLAGSIRHSAALLRRRGPTIAWANRGKKRAGRTREPLSYPVPTTPRFARSEGSTNATLISLSLGGERAEMMADFMRRVEETD